MEGFRIGPFIPATAAEWRKQTGVMETVKKPRKS